jgi:hypothetical protein
MHNTRSGSVHGFERDGPVVVEKLAEVCEKVLLCLHSESLVAKLSGGLDA